MASNKKKNVENARRFLWDETEDQTQRSRASGGTAGGRGFSTRDYAVDQSVNLMAMGEQPAAPTPSTRPSGLQQITGLFRATAPEGKFEDEYGDAAPSTESEEYIGNDKHRRSSPLFSACYSSMNSCATACGRVGAKGLIIVFCVVLGIILLIGGVIAATSSDKANRLESTVNAIVASGMTPAEALDPAAPESPQKSALNWIVHEDPAKLAPNSESMLERYALAVFYYGSNSHEWKSTENWMTGKATCLWHGIECIPRDQEMTEANNFVPITGTYDANEPILHIILTENNMEGTIPNEFSKLELILTLDFSDNKMSGSIPKSLATSSTLRNLLLRKNTFVGSIPKELATLTALHELHLGENRFEGKIPTEINQLKQLRALALSENLLTGTLPDMKQLTKLVQLYLDDNDFSGKIPDFIQYLTNLGELRLGKNKFSGTIPESFKELKKIEVLHLNDNKLTGSIPNFFDYTKLLQHLLLQNNQLVGEIPLKITHLQGLKKLHLDNNKLSGTIIPNLSILGDVDSISLHNNQFTGSIPSALGFLDDISFLSLNDNKLVGSIPSELGGCFRLVSLHLDSNQLTGSIPTELGKLDHLENLTLEENNLTGVTVPPQVCSLVTVDDLTLLSADCKSKVTCTCCTECR